MQDGVAVLPRPEANEYSMFNTTNMREHGPKLFGPSSGSMALNLTTRKSPGYGPQSARKWPGPRPVPGSKLTRIHSAPPRKIDPSSREGICSAPAPTEETILSTNDARALALKFLTKRGLRPKYQTSITFETPEESKMPASAVRKRMATDPVARENNGTGPAAWSTTASAGWKAHQLVDPSALEKCGEAGWVFPARKVVCSGASTNNKSTDHLLNAGEAWVPLSETHASFSPPSTDPPKMCFREYPVREKCHIVDADHQNGVKAALRGYRIPDFKMREMKRKDPIEYRVVQDMDNFTTMYNTMMGGTRRPLFSEELEQTCAGNPNLKTIANSGASLRMKVAMLAGKMPGQSSQSGFAKGGPHVFEKYQEALIRPATDHGPARRRKDEGSRRDFSKIYSFNRDGLHTGDPTTLQIDGMYPNIPVPPEPRLHPNIWERMKHSERKRGAGDPDKYTHKIREGTIPEYLAASGGSTGSMK